MSNYKPKPKSWFISRIGKRIYRDKSGCGCPSCLTVETLGMTVDDEAHADELAAVDAEWAGDGIFLNYRDKR